MTRKANKTTETVVEQAAVVETVEQAAVVEPVEQATDETVVESRLARAKRVASEATGAVVTKAKDFGTWIMDTLRNINWTFAGALTLVSAVFAFALAGIAAMLGLSAGLGMAVGAGTAALVGIVKRDELAQVNEVINNIDALAAAQQ